MEVLPSSARWEANGREREPRVRCWAHARLGGRTEVESDENRARGLLTCPPFPGYVSPPSAPPIPLHALCFCSAYAPFGALHPAGAVGLPLREDAGRQCLRPRPGIVRCGRGGESAARAKPGVREGIGEERPGERDEEEEETASSNRRRVAYSSSPCGLRER